MAAKKKLLVLKISEPLYENLKRSADLSRRTFGAELGLRIEYVLNQFENKPPKSEQIEKIIRLPTDEIVQIQLNEQVHSRF